MGIPMTCPLPQKLQQLIDETLPDDQQPAVQAHLETCPACQKKVEQLAAGAVTWDKAADILGDKPNPAETALIDAVEKLQDTPTSAIDTPTGPVERPKDEDLSFLQPSQKANSIGRLDKYEILSVVGKGGFGIVLKAFDEELHRVVAIKVLLPHLAANGAARKRFVREARAAAAIMHENVAAIHAVSEKEAKVPYLVMQFISGQTLGEKIDKAGPLGVKEVLRIGMQIAEGLAAANKHEGLVHRDIKPANILLENGVERVKISDFGLARSADDASVTQSGTVAGTPMYMSPEQANGEALDHRSDLFSLGSVLYVMCTGRPPFRATSTMAVMKRVCEDTPTPVQEVNPEIPDWLSDVITKLHAKKPGDRFQTAKEVAELLGQRLADVQAGRAIERALHVGGGSEPLTPPTYMGASQTDKNVWTQVFEGTDYRRRLIQLALLFATSLPALLIILAASRGSIVILPGEAVGAIVVLIAAGVFHVLWSIGFLIASVRVKNRWRVSYKGRMLELEFTVFGSERLYLDGELLARCGAGFAFQELQAAIPAGPGAGDKIRVLGHFGFFTPTCRLYASEGSPPTLAIIPSTWGRVRQRARPLAYAASIILPIALFIWFSVDQRQGYISLKTDVPDLVVLLDDQILRSGEGPDPEMSWNGKFKPLRTGQHTLRATKRGKVVFEQSFDLAFGETREFDLTRAALGEFVPVFGGPGWKKLYDGSFNGWKPTGTFETGPNELLLFPGSNFETIDTMPRNFHLRMEVNVLHGRGFVRFHAKPRTPGPDMPPPSDGWSLALAEDAAGNVLAELGAAPRPDRLHPRGEFDRLLLEKETADEHSKVVVIAKRSEWFYLEIIAKDQSTELLVNGQKTMTIKHPENVPSAGVLNLLTLGERDIPGGGKIAFRNVEIKDLTPPKEEPAWVKLFNGKDLTGWTGDYHKCWHVKDGLLTAEVPGKYSPIYPIHPASDHFHLQLEGKLGADSTMKIGFHASRMSTKARFGGSRLYRETVFDLTNQSFGLSRAEGDGVIESVRKTLADVKKPLAAPDKEFILELIVEGPKIRVLMNGASQIECTDPDWRQPDIWDLLQIMCWHPAAYKAGATPTLTIKKIELKELRPFVRFAHGASIAGWGQVIDPTGTCQVFRAADELAIYVPTGQYQLTTPKNMDAPRVMRDVKGDFSAQVTVLPFETKYGERVGAGLVVWKDREHFVRLVRERNEFGRKVLSVSVYREGKLETRKDFEFKSEEPIWLRVERRDGRLRFMYSTEEEWNEGPLAADEPWRGELKVGVCASNTTTATVNAPHPWYRFRDLQIKELPPEKKQ
jgi:regulation of enolase protein 1 (concanavalin A-like superfamily)